MPGLGDEGHLVEDAAAPVGEASVVEVPVVKVRRDSGLYGYERALHRVGLGPVAGADEAGRGACAGPLVAGAVILPDSRARQIKGLNDSKLLTARQRERLYDEITATALAWAVVSVEPGECDRLGMHVANVMALRRALLRLDLPATYVLTDGFPVDGLGVPGLAVWKGDRVAACVSAASILAKVTRDRIMSELDVTHPEYAFAVHKGYCTSLHQQRLDAYGPSATHRMRFENVSRTTRVEPVIDQQQARVSLVSPHHATPRPLDHTTDVAASPGSTPVDSAPHETRQHGSGWPGSAHSETPGTETTRHETTRHGVELSGATPHERSHDLDAARAAS